MTGSAQAFKSSPFGTADGLLAQWFRRTSKGGKERKKKSCSTLDVAVNLVPLDAYSQYAGLDKAKLGGFLRIEQKLRTIHSHTP